MGARVIITGVSVGTGKSHQWRDATSQLPVRPDESCVKVYFGISNVPGNSETALATITEAFATLRRRHDIEHYAVGLTGSVPHVICQPGVEVVYAVHAAGDADSKFVSDLRDKLVKLLDKTAAKKE